MAIFFLCDVISYLWTYLVVCVLLSTPLFPLHATTTPFHFYTKNKHERCVCDPCQIKCFPSLIFSEPHHSLKWVLYLRWCSQQPKTLGEPPFYFHWSDKSSQKEKHNKKIERFLLCYFLWKLLSLNEFNCFTKSKRRLLVPKLKNNALFSTEYHGTLCIKNTATIKRKCTINVGEFWYASCYVVFMVHKHGGDDKTMALNDFYWSFCSMYRMILIASCDLVLTSQSFVSYSSKL